MKLYKHSFNDIRIDSNISLFDVDVDFYIKEDMDLEITIQDIGMVLMSGVEYDLNDNRQQYLRLEQYYIKYETKHLIRKNHYADLLNIIKEKELAHAF